MLFVSDLRMQKMILPALLLFIEVTYILFFKEFTKSKSCIKYSVCDQTTFKTENMSLIKLF